jgi:hypothetical protein
MINCTVTANDGAGMIVAGTEGGSVAATARLQNTIVVGNTMDWQPTYTERLTGLLGTQGPPPSFSGIQDVADGVLGYIREVNDGGDIGAYNECLGGNAGVLAPFDDNNCGFLWFAGIGFSSSTEVRSTTTNTTAEDTMVAAGSKHGSFGDFCGGLEYFGRTESPTTATGRGSVSCDGTSVGDRYLGLRGRGYVGVSIRPLAAPTTLSDLFALPAFSLVDTAVAVNRGNQDVDWDPFAAGIQEPPATDLAGRPRIAGSRIDLGAFEVQP